MWRRIASTALCVVLLSTNMVGVLEAKASMAEISLIAEENQKNAENIFSDADVLEKITGSSDVAEQEETATPSNATEQSETQAVYTLYLTHYFRFTVDGKGKNVQVTETLELNEADFEDGVCDLTRFIYDVEQLTVTEARPLSIEDFDENQQGGARIVYSVSSGWRVVRSEDAAGEGSALREVFNGQFSDYEFVPSDVVRIHMEYQYSNTGGLAGIFAADPDTVEALPEKQADGTYKVEWTLPTVTGFRIVLNPDPLNAYLVKPPTGNETAAELQAALERGDFHVDINGKTVYYYQEQAGQITHPTYDNQYSTEYNQAWNEARVLTTDGYTAIAMGEVRGADGSGANPLVNPKLKVTLTEDQLQNVLKNGTELNIPVYYRRNATWYTVNHWVPQNLSGLDDFIGKETKTENGVDYVRLNQEVIQGRVGAMTSATAKTEDVYEKLMAVDFSQKLIENATDATRTTVDIYYKAADFYRVIFDTNYTYIPRQQVGLDKKVDFTHVNEPMRSGYKFGGWRYLKKDAQPDDNGEYKDSAYEEIGTDASGNPELKIDAALISKAKLQETGGVLALHLYPKWTPAKTQVRVVLWTEDLTGMDDVQAKAEGGNTNYYDKKYENYKHAPVTHVPKLGESEPNYSNIGSFVLNDVVTDSSLVNTANGKATLLSDIQTQVEEKFKEAVGTINGVEAYPFYAYAGYEIVHESRDSIDYSTTTAAADGQTMIYVYFTRNIYELQFHYYGNIPSIGSDYCVATNTNGYSRNQDFSSGFDFNTTGNSWKKADGINSAGDMPVPQTITIKAKYGADLSNVWPVALTEEAVRSSNQTVRMVSWATTDGTFNETAKNKNVLGIYSSMSAEIIADPGKVGTVHHMVAYWNQNTPSYYRYNHCLELPGLKIQADGIIQYLLYGTDTSNIKNVLYLVPIEKAEFAYDFNDLMTVSYDEDTKTITYNDPNGKYYAIRGYQTGGETRYFAITSQVWVTSTNTIGNQNPISRPHLTRLTNTADHSTQYRDSNGSSTNEGSGVCGTADNPYDLYFYYDRNRYTITYMAPINAENRQGSEVTLGTVTLPYGALVTQEKYGFMLDYQDTNQTQENGKSKYPWTTTGGAVSVCPDRSVDGTAVWKFKGWGLGPAGVNMQWTIPEDTETRGRTGDSFAITSDLQLYAIWEVPTYTVTFHLNGGTVNRELVEVKVSANTRYSANGFIPRPLRDGYILSGWYQADENGNVTEPRTAFDFDKVIMADQHVAAVWTAVSMERFDYNIYYVAKKLSDNDKHYPTVQIDNDKIVENGGETYYVLEKAERKNQMFLASSALNLTAKVQIGYVPQQTNKILTLEKPNDPYNVIFYYDPTTTKSHTVRFVEAGTEQDDFPKIVKSLQVEADQTVVTPQSAVATELVGKGYALVNKNAGGTYTPVGEAKDLTWIDEQGSTQSAATLAGDKIPATVTYLVKPIPYTITYQNAKGSPTAAAGALNAVTAANGTPVANAGNENPTQYTVKDNFTAKNPVHVYENGQWYEFSHWSLDAGTTETESKTVFSTLKVEPGTVGNLTFVANWRKMTAIGNLTVSKVVAGSAGNKNKDFTFTVTLGDTSINGNYGDMYFTNGVAVFTLQHGKNKTATGLPVDIPYKVVEQEANQGGYITSSTGESGTVKENGSAAAFLNVKDSGNPAPDPKTGNLIVSKIVTGDRGDTSKGFLFTIALGDTSINGAYGDIMFHDGVTAFTLKHGESMRATNLPDGIGYTVSESDNAGYTVMASGEAGTIENGETAIALFNNYKNGGDEPENPDAPNPPVPPVEPSEPDAPNPPVPPVEPSEPDAPNLPVPPVEPSEPGIPTDDVPQTGDETKLTIWLALLGISGVGMITMLAVSRRRREGKRYKR